MSWKGKKDEKDIVKKEIRRVLSAVSIELNREVKKRLTYEYLGIWTGTLRNTTGAILDNDRVYFGTNTGYGYGYETGNWNRANQYRSAKPGESYYQYKKRVSKRASWTGNPKRRPFLRDTIEDKDVQSRISMRLKNAG